MRRGQITLEFPAPPDLRVEVEAGASDLVLVGAEEPKIRVTAHYCLDLRSGLWGDLADTWEKALSEKPPVNLVGDVLRVGPGPEGIALDYEITLPLESSGEIRLGSGDIAVRNFSGKLSITTKSGDFSGLKVSGDLHLRTESGDIFLAQAAGAFTIHTGSGDITGEEVRGSIDAETSSGDIELLDFLGDLRVRTGSGDVEVEGEIHGETWEIHTDSGDILLKLPEDAEPEVDLMSKVGDVHCAFPLQTQEIRENLARGRIGTFPKGKIRVTAGFGDIVLRRR
jgi:hypothetical protein